MAKQRSKIPKDNPQDKPHYISLFLAEADNLSHKTFPIPVLNVLKGGNPSVFLKPGLSRVARCRPGFLCDIYFYSATIGVVYTRTCRGEGGAKYLGEIGH